MSIGPEERRPPLTPQLALRVAIVGSVALAMFAIIFFRLWFLQVLSGSQYVAAANVNRVRDIDIASPRGQILDSSGSVLVNSTKTLAVQISPPDLPVPVTLTNILTPPRADSVVYNKLAHVLGMPTKRIDCKHIALPPYHARIGAVACKVAQQVSQLPYADVTVKSGSVVTRAMQFYLAEREAQFPGISVSKIYVTHYPDKTLAAQVLGTVGPINTAELKERQYKGISQNSIIGQSGLEAQYNSFLQGKDGYQEVQVNALGQPTGTLHTKSPVQGHNLRLSLNAGLEQAGTNALQESMDTNSSPGGAFVAMNPTNGQVYGMGSLPSFNPSVFTGNLSQSTYNKLINPNNGEPLLNRATQSAGPTGSTFKVITATAALQSGVWGVDDTYDDTGEFCFPGTSDCLHNSGHAANGVLNLENAIRVSDDVFFYHLGYLTNADPQIHPNGGPLDQWASKFGIGRSTGIDLPPADTVDGTLPTPKWREHRDQEEFACEKKRHVSSCGIADGNPWTVGDNVNLAVGQGDVQVTPLQLAVVYSAIANGGTIVTPHLGLDIQNNDGTVLQTIDPGPRRKLPINPIYLQTIQAGLRQAASASGGTSADVMGTFPEQVYGKTGTAQYITPQNGEEDYAWYACFVPATATSKPIVVVVWVEKGGFGDVAAAPVARQILSQWFFGKPGKYQAGTSTTL
jgi:penicillin-binding protein 2